MIYYLFYTIIDLNYRNKDHKWRGFINLLFEPFYRKLEFKSQIDHLNR